MSKSITKIDPMTNGHLKLEFEDGSTTVAIRGQHLVRGNDGATHGSDPRVGDTWPPELFPVVFMPKATDQPPVNAELKPTILAEHVGELGGTSQYSPDLTAIHTGRYPLSDRERYVTDAPFGIGDTVVLDPPIVTSADKAVQAQVRNDISPLPGGAEPVVAAVLPDHPGAADRVAVANQYDPGAITDAHACALDPSGAPEHASMLAAAEGTRGLVAEHPEAPVIHNPIPAPEPIDSAGHLVPAEAAQVIHADQAAAIYAAKQLIAGDPSADNSLRCCENGYFGQVHDCLKAKGEAHEAESRHP